MGGTLEEHAQDIDHFIRRHLKQPPILVGHSFGGLVVQSYIICNYKDKAELAGVGLLASAPPQGNQAMIGRFWKADKIKALRLTWWATAAVSCMRQSAGLPP